MPIDLDEFGIDKESLGKILEDNRGKIKLRLGDGRVIDLLQEHLTSGIDAGIAEKDSVDDHDKVVDKDPRVGFEKVRSIHTKTGKTMDPLAADPLVNLRDGVFIGDLTEADLLKLKEAAGDLIRERDLTIVRSLLKKE